MVAFGAVMLTTQIGAHNDAGPDGTIGVHVCVQEDASGISMLYRIDPTDNCENVSGAVARHWSTWEAFVSEMAAAVVVDCPTAGGLLALLESLKDDFMTQNTDDFIFLNRDTNTHTGHAGHAGHADHSGLTDLRGLSTLEADAFLYVLLSSGGALKAQPDRMITLFGAFGLTGGDLTYDPPPGVDPASPAQQHVIDLIDRSRDVLDDYTTVWTTDTWPQEVLRALGESMACISAGPPGTGHRRQRRREHRRWRHRWPRHPWRHRQ